MIGRTRVATLLPLAAILAVAGYLRGIGLNWDEDSRLHPDERFLSMVEDKLAPVGSLREYFDTSGSPLNPNNRGYGFFVYGDLPIVVVQYVGRWFALPGNDLDRRWFGVDLGSSYSTVHRVRRGVSAVRSARHCWCSPSAGAYGRAVGLLAMASWRRCLPIQQAHSSPSTRWPTCSSPSRSGSRCAPATAPAGRTTSCSVSR
jgi:hypothetical protein